ncbi:hypothetical protein BZG36_01182 [Bifiguratus adelaidae]|uniref:Uncharacterized protein n=1 Tax=Bifiguratus adelaidae TaxID=1938954 RepID=A0A261Y5R1_9FUNG|nr:hypothetical protein BZG36_01182 [Bifiguratus adelaidae]
MQQSTFAPTKRQHFCSSLANTDQWLDTIEAVGANDLSNDQWTNDSLQLQRNSIAHRWFRIVKSFVDSCHARDIGTGYYYSGAFSNFLNVQLSEVINTVLVPGQVNVTKSTYDRIVLDQLTELWSNYGKLEKTWFDGGHLSIHTTHITYLLQKASTTGYYLQWVHHQW